MSKAAPGFPPKRTSSTSQAKNLRRTLLIGKRAISGWKLTITEEDQSNMAKKEQKKPSKKSRTKKADKAKKAGARAKKAAAPAKEASKVAAPAKKAASQPKKAAAPDTKSAVPEKKATPKPAKAAKFFSVAEFADMTYLTENGVMQWLKQGLLKGQQDEKGAWQVDASNLEVPNVKRLVR